MLKNFVISCIGKIISVILVGCLLLNVGVFTSDSTSVGSLSTNEDMQTVLIEGYHDIRPGEGVSEIKLLSDYFAPLKGTNGDTQVYVFNGDAPGPTAMILGGTHGNEISGILSAIFLIETAKVKAGRMIIIPVANYSASTAVDDWRPDVKTVSVETASGVRTFRYGNRRTNPLDQEYTNEPFIPYDDYELPAEESGNLNRVYPGKPDGNLTQQIAYAIMQLLDKEEVDIAIDMHEAGPKDSIAYYLISNPNVISISRAAQINIWDYDFDMTLDRSGIESIGLSHREWGDRTNVAAFLIETANPGQDYYDENKTLDVMKDHDNPIEKRVAVQIYTSMCVFDAYAQKVGPRLIIEGIPSYNDLLNHDIGIYMR